MKCHAMPLARSPGLLALFDFAVEALRASLRPLLLISGAILLGGCATPQPITPPPPAIMVPQDLHFKWRPPNGRQTFEIFISAGRYTRASDNGTEVYYSAEGGLVSRDPSGQPADKRPGGIAYSLKKGSYFVWKFAPSYIVRYPLSGVFDEVHDGPSVRIYLGELPPEIEHQLHSER